MEATQLEFGGLCSSVVVGGSDALHYGIQYDEGTNEATSWIVSEPDTSFAVHVEMMNRLFGENYLVHIYLDGHKVDGVVVKPDSSPVIHVKSIRVSHTEMRNFMFGSLELSDDDALLDASSNALGEIKILFYRVGSVVLSPNVNRGYDPPPQAQKVHERAKKGLAHSVKYGETQLDPLNPATRFYSYSDQILVASHIIRYRPLAMLQANGIVPYVPEADNGTNPFKSPSPVPGPSSAENSKKRKALTEKDVKPVIDLTSDDEEGIAQKEKQLQGQLAQLQNRRAQLQQRPTKKVKQEDRKPISPGDVIDLTI